MLRVSARPPCFPGFVGAKELLQTPVSLSRGLSCSLCSSLFWTRFWSLEDSAEVSFPLCCPWASPARLRPRLARGLQSRGTVGFLRPSCSVSGLAVCLTSSPPSGARGASALLAQVSLPGFITTCRASSSLGRFGLNSPRWARQVGLPPGLPRVGGWWSSSVAPGGLGATLVPRLRAKSRVARPVPRVSSFQEPEVTVGVSVLGGGWVLHKGAAEVRGGEGIWRSGRVPSG